MKEKEPLIKTSLLLRNKEFSGYQPDFARAILTKPAYTKTEARKTLDRAMNRKERE